MRKLVFAAGSPTLALAAAATLGVGVAAADDYAGQTYSDASSAIGGAGLKAVIASRSGTALPLDQCIVERSQKAPWLKGDNFAPVTDTVLLFLNCNARLAGAGQSGNSLASLEGRAEKAAEEQAAQLAQRSR